jgi:hypothetical protein
MDVRLYGHWCGADEGGPSAQNKCSTPSGVAIGMGYAKRKSPSGSGSRPVRVCARYGVRWGTGLSPSFGKTFAAITHPSSLQVAFGHRSDPPATGGSAWTESPSDGTVALMAPPCTTVHAASDKLHRRFCRAVNPMTWRRVNRTGMMCWSETSARNEKRSVNQWREVGNSIHSKRESTGKVAPRKVAAGSRNES